LLRSAILIASSSLLSFSAPATLGANSRLLAGGGEVQVTVDHHGQRPDRLNEKDDGDDARRPSHVVPQPHRAEIDRLLFTVEDESQIGGRVRSEVCELSENH